MEKCPKKLKEIREEINHLLKCWEEGKKADTPGYGLFARKVEDLKGKIIGRKW